MQYVVSVAEVFKGVIFASYDDLDGKPTDDFWGFLCSGTQETSPELLEEISLLAGAVTAPDPAIAGPTDPDRPVIVGFVMGGAVLAAAAFWLRRRRQRV